MGDPVVQIPTDHEIGINILAQVADAACHIHGIANDSVFQLLFTPHIADNTIPVMNADAMSYFRQSLLHTIFIPALHFPVHRHRAVKGILSIISM